MATILPLSKRLKQATHAHHERVDQGIMALQPFASREGYMAFLKVQYRFQRHTASLYHDPALAEWITDLPERCRFPAIKQDCEDLGVDTEALDGPQGPEIATLPEALGWLYVNEGSNLGAAFLLKYAAALELTREFGARHLAPSDSGRGAHWRQFTAQLDAIELTEEQQRIAIKGAQDAFAHVEALAATRMG
ncbi:biliverdin-producing heme oxygenase [Billgrantia endophytica]|uniref:Biliverdin-producing heme oxygenase n=2 Tax=Billgrantia endophytica TaxID=2033802 RepID=A0A2N7TXJ5_9GAMM|nr:biliverdin-producing heme oxygenase [Halomonas endophytica]